jgi:hypothetical protein
MFRSFLTGCNGANLFNRRDISAAITTLDKILLFFAAVILFFSKSKFLALLWLGSRIVCSFSERFRRVNWQQSYLGLFAWYRCELHLQKRCKLCIRCNYVYLCHSVSQRNSPFEILRVLISLAVHLILAIESLLSKKT